MNASASPCSFAAPPARQLPFELVPESEAVGEPGQRIVHGEVRETTLGLLEVADVARDEREALDATVGGLAGHAEHRDRHERVVDADRELTAPGLAGEDLVEAGLEVVVVVGAFATEDVGEVRQPRGLEPREMLVPGALHVCDGEIRSADEDEIRTGLHGVDEPVDVGAGLDYVGDIHQRDDHAHGLVSTLLGDGGHSDPHRGVVVRDPRNVRFVPVTRERGGNDGMDGLGVGRTELVDPRVGTSLEAEQAACELVEVDGMTVAVDDDDAGGRRLGQ